MINTEKFQDSPHAQALNDLALPLENVGIVGLVATLRETLDDMSPGFAGAVRTALDQRWRDEMEKERERLLAQADRYANSTTFMNHLATLAEFADEPQAAIDALTSVLPQDSTGYIRECLSKVLIARGELVQAKELLSDSESLESYLIRASTAIAEQELDHAQDFVEKALDADSSNHRVLLLAGFLALGNRDTNRAIRFLRSSCQESTGSATPYVLLGRVYQHIGQESKALTAWRKAVAFAPLDEGIVIRAANRLIANKQLDHAVSILCNFLELKTDSVHCWERLGSAHYFARNYRAATDAFQQQLAIRDDHGVRNNLGLARWRMGQTAVAIQHFSQAIRQVEELGFPSFLPLYNAALVLHSLEQYRECLKIVDLIPKSKFQQLASSPIVSSILVVRFEALTALGRYSEAERLFHTLVANETIHRDLRLDLLHSGTYFYSLAARDLETALRCVRQLLAMLKTEQPDSKFIRKKKRLRILNNAVFVLLEANIIDDAEALFPQLQAHIYADPYVTATFGLWHLKKGHLSRGKDLYRRAERSLPGGTKKEQLRQKHHLEVGKALLRHGREAEGLRELKRASRVRNGLPAITTEAQEILRSGGYTRSD